MSPQSRRKLEARWSARPGEFANLVKWELRDNDHAPPSKRLTHVVLVCEICDSETESIVGAAEAVARRFDGHACKPKEDWPERPARAPRINPLEQAAKREQLRREMEEE